MKKVSRTTEKVYPSSDPFPNTFCLVSEMIVNNLFGSEGANPLSNKKKSSSIDRKLFSVVHLVTEHAKISTCDNLAKRLLNHKRKKPRLKHARSVLGLKTAKPRIKHTGPTCGTSFKSTFCCPVEVLPNILK